MSGHRSNQKGVLAEQFFTYHAVKNGFLVSTPIGHASDYDFILDAGDGLFRVQVKSNFCGRRTTAGGDKPMGGYRVTVRKGGNSKREKYSDNAFDYFAIYISEYSVFYLIPKRLVEVGTITLYPKKTECRFHHFKNNWDLKHA